MKRLGTVAAVVTMVFFAAGWLWADGVLPTDLNAPDRVVEARKAMMNAIKANVGAMGNNFQAGTMENLQASGLAVAVMAQVMPPLYRETYPDAYSGKGKYFKGAPAPEFEAAAERLRASSSQAVDAAGQNDKRAVVEAMVEVQNACGRCHDAYRGSF